MPPKNIALFCGRFNPLLLRQPGKPLAFCCIQTQAFGDTLTVFLVRLVEESGLEQLDTLLRPGEMPGDVGDKVLSVFVCHDLPEQEPRLREVDVTQWVNVAGGKPGHINRWQGGIVISPC